MFTDPSAALKQHICKGKHIHIFAVTDTQRGLNNTQFEQMFPLDKSSF